MRIRIDVSAVVHVPGDVPSVLQVDVNERGLPYHVEESGLKIEPADDQVMEAFTDLYGNLCQRLMLKTGENRIAYGATVVYGEGPDKPAQLQPSERGVMGLPAETLHYLLPSRYCPSDRFLAVAYDMFGDAGEPQAQVDAICRWINTHVFYRYGVSDSSTSAVDTLLHRQGVCRDFAHLAISFCRAVNIPARYVSGYCLGLKPPDFHAFFQAHLDGRWVTFDATWNGPREALIEVAYGRDAADCAWCTIYGGGETTALNVSVSRLDSPASDQMQ